ncbi:unnamed protein product, partial [Plutella xylostella]
EHHLQRAICTGLIIPLRRCARWTTSNSTSDATRPITRCRNNTYTCNRYGRSRSSRSTTSTRRTSAG